MSPTLRAITPLPPPADIPDARWCGAMLVSGRAAHVFTYEGYGDRFVLVGHGFTDTLDRCRTSSVDWICLAAQIVDRALGRE